MIYLRLVSSGQQGAETMQRHNIQTNIFHLHCTFAYYSISYVAREKLLLGAILISSCGQATMVCDISYILHDIMVVIS